MNQPLVSVIIPAYNSEKFIEEAILSVVNQSYPYLEVVIVDDGSTDKQKVIIFELIASDPRIRYIYQPNQGVSVARNNGFALAKGDFLAFLDADDVWLPDNLSEKLKKFKTGDFGLVHSDGLIMSEDANLTGTTLEGCEGMLLEGFLKGRSTQIPGPSSILVKREVLETIGLFDINLSTSADYDFFLRIAFRFKIGRVPKPTWKYRLHVANMHKNIAVMERDILYVFKKASANQFFRNKSFENQCYANMYLTLAASWMGEGRNIWKGIYFTLFAITCSPAVLINILQRVKKS